jgi:UDP-N-acetylglucosamine 4,6-dehydratase
VIETWGSQAELSVTDPLMTRFYFSLQKSVDYVLRALERMQGGEIFVPRMHSVAMGNLAIALYPDKPMRLIGARPGEKYHETLVSQDELYRARWLDDCAVILPSSREWAADYSAYESAPPMRVPLTSEANPERIDGIDAICEWVKQIESRRGETL